MASYPLIDEYLSSLRQHIGRVSTRESFVGELVAHLDESVQNQIIRGASLLNAQRSALSLFGDPRTVAKAFHQNAESWLVDHSHLARVAMLLGMAGGLGWVSVAGLTTAIYLHPTGVLGQMGTALALLTTTTCACTGLFLSSVAPARSGHRSNWRAVVVPLLAFVTALILVDQLLVGSILLAAASWLTTDRVHWLGPRSYRYARLLIRWALPLAVLPIIVDQLLSSIFTPFGIALNSVETVAFYRCVGVYGVIMLVTSSQVRRVKLLV